MLLKIQKDEIKRTGISSLKISYNKVFGYYLEVTNAHKDKVPETWIRKQTLVNSERYITEQLKEYEEKILNAEEKIFSIEKSLYLNIVYKLSKKINNLQKISRSISHLDCLLSFANLAKASKFSKPEIVKDKIIEIQKGRHLILSLIHI